MRNLSWVGLIPLNLRFDPIQKIHFKFPFVCYLLAFPILLIIFPCNVISDLIFNDGAETFSSVIKKISLICIGLSLLLAITILFVLLPESCIFVCQFLVFIDSPTTSTVCLPLSIINITISVVPHSQYHPFPAADEPMIQSPIVKFLTLIG